MKSLINAVNKEFFFEKFFLNMPVETKGENPVFINAEFPDGKVVRYNLSLKGEIEKVLEINRLQILPTNIWGIESKYLFDKIIRKNEKIAKELHQDYVIIEQIDKHVEYWLRLNGYDTRKENGNMWGVKKLK